MTLYSDFKKVNVIITNVPQAPTTSLTGCCTIIFAYSILYGISLRILKKCPNSPKMSISLTFYRAPQFQIINFQKSIMKTNGFAATTLAFRDFRTKLLIFLYKFA